MRKIIVLFLAVLMLVTTVSASYAWDRGGRHNQRQYNNGHRHYNYWRDVGAGLYILGGAAVLGAIANPYNYGCQPYTYQRNCTKEIRYGYWEYDSFGQRHWITTHIEYEPIPCY